MADAADILDRATVQRAADRGTLASELLALPLATDEAITMALEIERDAGQVHHDCVITHHLRSGRLRRLP